MIARIRPDVVLLGLACLLLAVFGTIGRAPGGTEGVRMTAVAAHDIAAHDMTMADCHPPVPTPDEAPCDDLACRISCTIMGTPSPFIAPRLPVTVTPDMPVIAPLLGRGGPPDLGPPRTN